MKLKNFIKKYVEKNTMIRLWYKINGGSHELVSENYIEMEHQIVLGDYKNHNVIGVTDILCKGNYVEAVNIVIERK